MFHLSQNAFIMSLQELVAPVTKALVTVGGLLGVCPGQVLDPIHEKVLVLLEQEELAQDDVCLVEALSLQSLADHGSDPRQVGHWLLTHWLSHEVPVLLRRCRHDVLLYVYVEDN